MNWAMIDGGWRISPAFSFWRYDCPGSAILLANGSDRERILFLEEDDDHLQTPPRGGSRKA